MVIQLFSTKPFNLSVRSEFELPAWPHTENDDHFQLFADRMEELFVFKYRDTEQLTQDTKHDFNFKLVTLNKSGEFTEITPEDELTEFFAFKHKLVVDNEEFKIKTWPQGFRRKASQKAWADQADAYGDEYAWEEFNIPIRVTGFDTGPDLLTYSVVTELLMVCPEPTCMQHDVKRN